MTQADTRTVEQVVLGRALLEKPCPYQIPGTIGEGYHDDRFWPCACLGTGQVAKFPMLREPCQGKHGTITYFAPLTSERINRDRTCNEAGCRGWLPVVTTDALLEVACSLGVLVILRWRPETKVWTVMIGAYEGEGDSLQEALFLALEAALGIEVVP